jgi:hypothetical protein
MESLQLIHYWRKALFQSISIPSQITRDFGDTVCMIIEDIAGSHGGEYDGDSLLRYGAV